MAGLRQKSASEKAVMVDETSKRMHERVRQYWQSVKEQRPYPTESEIDPQFIADAWNYCFLVDMRRHHTHKLYKYQYIGRELVEAYGANMTGMEFQQEDAPHISAMISNFHEVEESGEPGMYEVEFVNARGVSIRTRCCLLPLGRDRVELILGCMRWKLC